MDIPKKYNKKKGFTVIELLVVIAMISLLASVILVSLNSARAKARDAKRITDFRQVHNAMELYYDRFGTYPGDNTLFDNTSLGHRAQFEAMTQELVNSGFLNTIPKDPLNLNGAGLYMFYDYGAGSPAGAIIVTSLEKVNPTTAGSFNSCRPFDQNWCSSTIASTAYCICHPY